MSYQANSDNVGIAAHLSDDVYGEIELFAGDTPAPVTISANVPSAIATAGLPARTPVQVNAENGDIALVDGTTITKANAITVAPVAAGAPANSKVPVYKAACVNINALKWPASMNTEAKKLAGFDMASCQIYVKKPFYA